MATQTVPLEVRLTDPHAFRVTPAGGGIPVLEVDTLTLATKLSGRLLLNGVDIGALAHAAVTLGGGSDPALALVGQELTLADVLTPAEHTAIGAGAPHHAAVTLGGGSDPALALAGQQLTLADVLTAAEADLLYEALGDIAIHAALATGVHGAGASTLATLLDLTTHTALTGAHHSLLHAAAQHNAAALPGGFNENLGAFYLDIDDIAVPANPGASIRRLFVNQATGELSVRTNAGATVSLEAGGGGVAAHNLLDGVVHLDTVLQGCSRGSLIYGTSGLLWDELIVGAVGTFLRADGVDVYYGLILDADIPAIHSGTAHHVKYTDAEAILAVEGHDPLDLLGDVTIAAGKSLAVDTIIEKTGAAGVTIDGLLLKDEYIEFDEIAAPGGGGAGKGRLYVADEDAESNLYFTSDTGAIYALAQGRILAADSSADLTLTNAWQDVAGATITLNRTGKWLVVGALLLQERAGASGVKELNGQLLVNGVAQTGQAIVVVTDQWEGSTLSRSWLVDATDGHITKLQAKMNAAGGTYKAMSPHTNISAVWVAP